MPEASYRPDVSEPVELTVDGVVVEAQSGELLIAACERNGTYVPRFCYHPRMTPVGMCRMCLVEVDTGRGPALQPSCMLPVTSGMVVETASDLVVKAQDGILEFLLANHPLDCPVCDKGGECPLQDQAYSHGPGESRMVEEKRHFDKPIPISELVYLDRERCILCDRCTRFADEVAGDPLIHFINRGAGTEINTFPGEPFASHFSGNTVQICPVGALTAKPYRFKARPWDLEEVESTCTRCSVGCRVTVESSRNRVVRLQGVDADPVNWGWLCDKGRFGFEAQDAEGRLREPLLRGEDGELAPVRWADAIAHVAGAIRAAVDHRGPSSVAVLGGSMLTNEAAYAWAKLAKSVIGTDNADAQLDDGLPAGLVLGLPGTTIDDVCAAGGTILWLGPDPKEELPVLHLRLRHAVQRDGARLVQVAPTLDGLSPYATHTVLCRPGEEGATVRALLTGDRVPEGAGGAAELLRAAGDSLSVCVGRSNLAESAAVVVGAARAVHDLVPGARFLPVLRRGNVRGAIEAGLAPGLLPGGVPLSAGTPEGWASSPTEVGLDAAGILDAAANGRIEVLVLVGADPLADVPDRSLARRGLAGARTVVSVDPLLNASARHADVVLASATFAEVDGTTTNLEGRVSVLSRKVTPPGTARADWIIATDLAAALGGDLGVVDSEADLWEELCSVSPAHGGLSLDALRHAPTDDGLLVDLDARAVAPPPAAVEVPPPNSYSLRLVVQRRLYDRGTLVAHSPSSAGLAGAAAARIAPGDAAPLGVDDGDTVQLTSAHGTVTLPVALDASVPRGTVVVPHNLDGADPGELVAAGDPVCDVRVEVG